MCSTPTRPILFATPEILLQEAVRHHQSGQLLEAERLYGELLTIQAGHPDAHHNLGVLARQRQQPDAALTHFKQALEANPARGQYWVSYVDALLWAGRYDLAGAVLTQGQAMGLAGAEVDALAERLAAVSPQVGELADLSRLFARGQYAELAARAEELIRRFPGHSAGWKALGAALKMAGRVEEALAPLLRTAELLPGDAEAHNNLGLALYELHRLAEAKAHYARALELQPGYVEAHCNLGLALFDEGQMREAESCYRQALAVKPDHVPTHSNLGNLLHAAGRLAEAEAALRQALSLDPDYVPALNNLGNVLGDLRRRDEASACYRRALAVCPDHTDAQYNLAHLLQEIGQLQAAEAAYRRTLALRPDYGAASYNLGHTLLFLDDLAGAGAAYERAFALEPQGHGLDGAVNRAILHFLANEDEACRAWLANALPIAGRDEPEHRNGRIYRDYLARILAAQPAGTAQDMPALYVIGESHALVTRGLAVAHAGAEWQCRPQWIPGCKQWHLAQAGENAFKQKFARTMAALPRGARVLLTIGEIDCRYNEGVLSAWKKRATVPLSSLVADTVGGFVAHVAGLARAQELSVIVGGVPSPNGPALPLVDDELRELAELIGLFNRELGAAAVAAGLDFLDIHALTDRGDGLATGEWHIDHYHLLPEAFREAFRRHGTAAMAGGKA